MIHAELLSLFIGIGALLIGAGAIFFPIPSSKAFGVEADAARAPYVRTTGARDLFVGLVFIFAYFRGDRSSLGILCLFTAVVSGADFIVTHLYGSKLKSWLHFSATLAVIIYGFCLLKF